MGSESTEAGCASDLFSDASAAAVTWAIMKPEFTPLSATRKGGKPLSEESINSAIRRSQTARDCTLLRDVHVLAHREGHTDQMRLMAGSHSFGAATDALHFAALSMDSVVELLAKNGANLEAADRQNRTPMDMARGRGGPGRAGAAAEPRPSTIDLLHKLGAR